MKHFYIILISIFLPVICFCQSDNETDILKLIILNEAKENGIYLKCDKRKTNFDSSEYLEEEPDNELSNKKISELIASSETSIDDIWDFKIIKKLKFNSKTLLSNKCLSDKDVSRIFERTKRRQNIVSISQPIFDSNYENCIVSVDYTNYIGSAHGHSYLLKKVNGIWKIESTFNLWVT